MINIMIIIIKRKINRIKKGKRKNKGKKKNAKEKRQRKNERREWDGNWKERERKEN